VQRIAWPSIGLAIVVVVGAVKVLTWLPRLSDPGETGFGPPPHPARARQATAVMISAVAFIRLLYGAEGAGVTSLVGGHSGTLAQPSDLMSTDHRACVPQPS